MRRKMENIGIGDLEQDRIDKVKVRKTWFSYTLEVKMFPYGKKPPKSLDQKG